MEKERLTAADVALRSAQPDRPLPGPGRKISGNAVRCKNCGDVIESQSTHDFVKCSCGACAVDGGIEYLRRVLRDESAYEELSEFEN